MSDASQRGYVESGYNFEKAIEVGKQRDSELLNIYGSRYELARVQSSAGQEFPNPPRSRFLVTTNIETAIYYSRGDSVYASWIPKSMMTPSPLNNTTGGENEYFVPVAYPMIKINPNFTNEDLKED